MGMRDGICPECGSKDIYVSNPPGIWTSNASNVVVAKHDILLGHKIAKVVHYVCSSCYFLASYIADEESLENITNHWHPLNPEKRKNDA
jgi:hypothetical protein